MRKSIKIVLLIVALLAVLVCSQLLLGPTVKITEVEAVSWDGTYDSVVADAERYSKGESFEEYEHIISFDGNLPSSNPEDYMSVYVKYKAKNLSYIQDVAVSAYLEDIGKYKENVLFATDSDGILPMLLYNGYKGDGYIILDVYTGNLNDEQIEELIRSVTVKIVNDKEYMGSSEKVLSYENVDSIEIKHYEDE